MASREDVPGAKRTKPNSGESSQTNSVEEKGKDRKVALITGITGQVSSNSDIRLFQVVVGR